MSNKIIVLTGVSGVGKTTIANALKENYNFKSSVSYTTRQIRPNEKNKVDYNFISKNEFLINIKNNFFLEYDEMFGNYYGTAKQDVECLLKKNNVVFTLSTEGYKNIKKLSNSQIIGFYLLPPSKSELMKRISTRNSSNIEIQNRLHDIYTQSQEESHCFDYVIKPNSIQKTLKIILKTLKNMLKTC